MSAVTVLEWNTLPEPVLFNRWKHHAGAIRERIQTVAASGRDAIAALPPELVVIGSDLMDLYLGELDPVAVVESVLAQLREQRLDVPDAYQKWIDSGSGYRLIELPEDGSSWTLRRGNDSDRFVHLHPGRGSVSTMRIRANVLKTAIMVRAHVLVHGGDPFDREVVNQVRITYLNFAPVRQIVPEEGIGRAIAVLG